MKKILYILPIIATVAAGCSGKPGAVSPDSGLSQKQNAAPESSASSRPAAVSQATAASPQTSNPAPAQKPAARQVTVTGIVMSKTSNTLIIPPYSFVLSDGKQNYTVIVDNATSKNTKVINLRGREVDNNFIQVANTVTVTGILNGLTITAQTIQVQTAKDDGA